MVALPGKMKVSPNEVREAGIASMFLDIGTMQLPAELAPENGDYRNVDPEIWQKHVRVGVAALGIAGGIAEPVKYACFKHHERFDGGGFPQGLTGPDILRQFIETVGIHPVGSFVRLRSKRLAMVIDQQSGNLTRLVVRVFYSLVGDQRVSNQTIELANCSGKAEIVGLADLTGLVLSEEAQLCELIFLSALKMGQ